MTTFNITEEKSDPIGQSAAINTTPNEVQKFTKEVPEQGWAMAQALSFISSYTAGLRDPDYLSETVAASIKGSIDQGDSNAEKLSAYYEESTARRAVLELESIDENDYLQQRDPRLLANLVKTLLTNRGLEVELEEDMTVTEETSDVVSVSDQAVRETWKEGDEKTPQQIIAEEIAEKLGIEIEGTVIALNLNLPTITQVDSTDPYIKKVSGQ